MSLIRYSIFSLLVFGLAATSRADVVLTALLNGASEATPNNSTGTGTATITFDDVLLTMRVQASFSNLTGNSTQSHIHATTALPNTGLAGVATELPSFTGFPLGVTSGSYDHTFDMNSATNYSAAFLAANGGTTATAYAALRDASIASRAYLNIHSTTFGGGEIRGFLAVPEPSLLGMAGLLCGLTMQRRQRRNGN